MNRSLPSQLLWNSVTLFPPNKFIVKLSFHLECVNATSCTEEAAELFCSRLRCVCVSREVCMCILFSVLQQDLYSCEGWSHNPLPQQTHTHRVSHTCMDKLHRNVRLFLGVPFSMEYAHKMIFVICQHMYTHLGAYLSAPWSSFLKAAGGG